MNIERQSVNQTVSAMADVLAEYLNPEEVRLLTTQWQQHSSVSIKMMQQCVLDATRRYPELQAYKSDIRKGFWDSMQADQAQATAIDDNLENSSIVISEQVLAFYTVMDALSSQLTAADSRSLFQTMHQNVAKERTFKGRTINMNHFLAGHRPTLPDDEHLLNTLIQLAYVGLCDIVGPVEADTILFQAAQMAKQSHPNTVVEKLF